MTVFLRQLVVNHMDLQAFRIISIDLFNRSYAVQASIAMKSMTSSYYVSYWVPMNFSCTQGCSLADCSIGRYIWDCNEQDFLACAGAWIMSQFKGLRWRSVCIVIRMFPDVFLSRHDRHVQFLTRPRRSTRQKGSQINRKQSTCRVWVPAWAFDHFQDWVPVSVYWTLCIWVPA